MIAKGGAELLQGAAIKALTEELFPLATVITPNLPEASKLLGVATIASEAEMRQAVKELHRLGPENVVLKGGHLSSGPALDLIYDGNTIREYRAERIQTKHTHGTGCTFAAAIAAELAKGAAVEKAVGTAKAFISAAIEERINIGSGIGPTNHAAYRKRQR